MIVGRAFRLARAGCGMDVSHVRRLLSSVTAIVPRITGAVKARVARKVKPFPGSWAGGRVLLAGRARVCPHSRFRWSEARWSALWAGRSQAVYTQEVDGKTGKGSAAGRTGHAIIKSPA